MQDFGKLIEEARQATTGVSDPDLRGRAFQSILEFLLEGGNIGETKQAAKNRTASPPIHRPAPTETTLPGRIVSLKSDDFFKSQRTIVEVQGELRKRGWHYPLTSLSGPMQSLVRQRELRREQVKDGKKKVWKYSNS